jgi:tRNA(fMet)-specific endonuclease VapC
LSQIPTSTSIDFVVDTNVAIDFLNHPAASAAKVGTTAKLAVPVIVLGELFYGAEKSSRTTSNLARIDAFLQDVRVLRCDLDTARHFGRVRLSMRAAGTPIPHADFWIAAVAIEHQLPLLTRDKHFGSVPGLRVVNW